MRIIRHFGKEFISNTIEELGTVYYRDNKFMIFQYGSGPPEIVQLNKDNVLDEHWHLKDLPNYIIKKYAEIDKESLLKKMI